jgi:hypothetical protein
MLRPYLVVRIASAKLAFIAGLGLAPAVGAHHSPASQPQPMVTSAKAELSTSASTSLSPNN